LALARDDSESSKYGPKTSWLNIKLSFLDHYWASSIYMDVEWLLSTLFDASLLSPSSRRPRRLFFHLACPDLMQIGVARCLFPALATMSKGLPARRLDRQPGGMLTHS
jgi:hypothetical protein